MGVAFLRYILFCLFFTVGATATVISIMTDELEDYYRSRSVPDEIEARNAKLRTLISRYEQQIEQVKQDPSLLQKLEPITFGAMPQAEDTAFPVASDTELAAAQQALHSGFEQEKQQRELPEWLDRIAGPENRRNRLTLFVAGTGLILVNFIFFGAPPHRYRKRKAVKPHRCSDSADR